MLFYLSIITLILTLSIIFHNYKINKNSLLLAGYLIPICFHTLLNYVLFEGNSTIAIAIFYRHFSPLFYLPGAMLFLYVRGSLKNQWIFSKRDLWHFLPFCIGLLNILPYYFVGFSQKMDLAEKIYTNPNFHKFEDSNLFYAFNISAIVRCSLSFGYGIASFILLFKYWKNSLKHSYDISKKNLFRWLVFLNTNAVILTICYTSIAFIFFTHIDLKKTDINAFHYTLITGLTFCLIPIVMIFYPQVVYGIPISIMSDNRKRKVEKEKIEQQKNEISLLADKIMAHFENDKTYLNKDFSLDDLAQHLEVPKHQLYACFNTCIHKKFTQLRTNFRVAYAKKLLSGTEIDAVHLQEIWTKSGFSSKTNFFTTFKEETGLTPTAFIQQEQQTN